MVSEALMRSAQWSKWPTRVPEMTFPVPLSSVFGWLCFRPSLTVRIRKQERRASSRSYPYLVDSQELSIFKPHRLVMIQLRADMEVFAAIAASTRAQYQIGKFDPLAASARLRFRGATLWDPRRIR